MPERPSIFRDTGTGTRAIAGGWEPSRREEFSPRKVMVLVHGAGYFDENYHVPIVAEIQVRLNKAIDCLPVQYSNVTNPLGRSQVVAGADLTPACIEFQRELARDTLVRAMAALPAAQVLGILTSSALPNGFDLVRNLFSQLQTPQVTQAQWNLFNHLEHTFPGLPLVDWVRKINTPVASFQQFAPNFAGFGGIDLQSMIRTLVLYLTNPTLRDQVKSQLRRQLDQAMQYDEIVLVSHSLGTVVAFDLLAECADAYAKISYWFTLGCPLVKIQRLGYPTFLGKISPAAIRNWLNIYDTTDIVANAIGPVFSGPYYPLHDIFIDVGKDPLGSHDYLRNSETLDMIASTLA